MSTIEVIGESPQIKQVLRQIRIVALTNFTVIIQGETGTGKELVAREIHKGSRRKDNPFIPLDCGAIPEPLAESELFGYEKGAFTGAYARKEGKFEQANGGTLFLDEITNLSDALQMKLLRVIQERRLQPLGGKRDVAIDVRIIAATNTDFFEAVRVGKFRDDLFYRLNEFLIVLPSLKERIEDIMTLANYFLDEANRELNKKIKGFSADTMMILLNYRWPGNVRELRNVIRKAALLADSNYINPTHLLLNNGCLPQNFDIQQDLRDGTPLKEITKKAIKQIEAEIIKQVLVTVGGNKTKASKILKIDRVTLYSKIKEFKLEIDHGKDFKVLRIFK